jgi:hypothetical protein
MCPTMGSAAGSIERATWIFFLRGGFFLRKRRIEEKEAPQFVYIITA